MRRVVVQRSGAVVVERALVPSPSANEVLVSMLVSGICGSDTHAAHGMHPFIDLPYHPGHEVVGVVEEVGAEVTSVTVGQRITVEPTLVCGQCKQCVRGRENLCENLRFFGCGYEQGGMAEYFTIPASRVHDIPDEFTDQQAALVEPLSTPVHAVRLAGDVQDRPIAILGAGTIGLLVLAAVRHYGARRVIMTDLLEGKRRRALRHGADAVIDASRPDIVAAVCTELGESADVVFDCVAVQSTVDQAIGMALKGGTVVVVGVPTRDVTIPLPLIQDQQIRIQGSATYLPDDYQVAIEMIGSGEVAATDFITGMYPLDDVSTAFAAAAAGEQVKVLVTASPVP